MAKFSDRHRPERKLWQKKLRGDLARGINRPMFPKQGDTKVINCDAINCINNKVRVCQLESINIDNTGGCESYTPN